MIQQMIYRRTDQGYRTVAISPGLVGKGIVRRIEGLSKSPQFREKMSPGALAVYSRCTLDGGFAALRTAVDPHGDRGSRITHALYVPPEDVAAYMQGGAAAENVFMAEYREKSRMDSLPAVAPQELPRVDTFSLGCAAAQKLFGRKAELLSQLIAAVVSCGVHPSQRGFLGVCVMCDLDEASVSLYAYHLMEVLLRSYAQEQVGTVGYRSLWNKAEDNVLYPVFFTTYAITDPEESVPASYILFDLTAGTVRLPRDVKLQSDDIDVGLAAALLRGDVERVRTIRQEADQKRLAKAAEQKRLAEEAEKQRLAKEAEQKRIAEQKRLAEEAEQKRIAEQKRLAEEAEQQRLAEEAEQKRIAEQKRLAEEAEQQRLAEEAEQKRIAEQKRQAEQAQPVVRRTADSAAVQWGRHAPVPESVRTETPSDFVDEMRRSRLAGSERKAMINGYLKKTAGRDKSRLTCAVELLEVIIEAITAERNRKYVALTRCAYSVAETVWQDMLEDPMDSSAQHCMEAMLWIDEFLEKWGEQAEKYISLRIRDRWFVYMNILSGNDSGAVMCDCVESIRATRKNGSSKDMENMCDGLREIALAMLETCLDMPKRSRNWNRLFHQAAMAAVLLEMKFSVSGKMFWKEDPITDKSILRVLRKMKQKDLFTDEMEVLIDEITR